MKKTFSTLLITTTLIGGLLFTPKAYADCQPIYGGGQTCTSYSFTIQKLVQVPGKGGGNYVNSLSINDAKYASSQTVNFELIVTNTDSQTIPTINVTDTLPKYLTYVSGGSYNSSNNTVNFTINNLGAGQSQTYYITAKVADATSLPTEQGIICLVNQAAATDNNGVTNSSSSQFCVQKTVLGTTTPTVYSTPVVVNTPATGPEMLPLMALIPGGLGGLILRKKTNKNEKGGEK